jgi:hypothetical protein
MTREKFCTYSIQVLVFPEYFQSVICQICGCGTNKRADCIYIKKKEKEGKRGRGGREEEKEKQQPQLQSECFQPLYQARLQLNIFEHWKRSFPGYCKNRATVAFINSSQVNILVAKKGPEYPGISIQLLQ